MKISVIIPVYKVKEYLEECVESVLVQDFSGYEIILVDDGCPDGCGEICDNYVSKYPKKITVIHQENAGPGGARNAGIKRAAGEYLLFLDSDDRIEKNSLKILYTAAENHGFPDSVIFAHMVGSGETGWTVSEDLPENIPMNLETHPKLMFASVTAWGRLIKREIYTKNEIFFPERKFYEDLYTTPKLLLKSEKNVYIGEHLYHYRRRDGSIMNTFKPEKVKDRVKAIGEVVSYYKEQGGYEKYYSELCFLAVSHLFNGAMQDILKNGDFSLITPLSEYMKTAFPKYNENKYISALPGYYSKQIQRVHAGRIKSVIGGYKRRQLIKRIMASVAPKLTAKLAK